MRLCDTDQNIFLVRVAPNLVGRGGKGAEVHTAVTLLREGKGGGGGGGGKKKKKGGNRAGGGKK